MLSEVPKIQVPESFSRICKLRLANTRVCFGEISDILESDDFLNHFVRIVFKKYLQKGGVLGMLTALGWEGFRNRLGEAYLFYMRNKTYPDDIELDEIYDVIDIEKRFNFLCLENSSRSFLMGFYLKICEIERERNEESFLSVLSIPVELDEVLDKGKSRKPNEDWLVMTTWFLLEILGKKELLKQLSTYNTKVTDIVDNLSEDYNEKFMHNMIQYAFGINDKDFLTVSRI